VLNEFNLYDLFVLCFVQLILATVLVLSPARHVGTRFSWTGARITEVLLATLCAAGVSALSAFLAIQLWNLDAAGVETSAYILTLFSVVVIILRPDCNVVGQLFYGSYAAAGFAFIAFAGWVAANATHSIGEALTSSLLILLNLAAFMVWNSNINYVSDVFCRTRHSRPPPTADPTYQPMVSIHIPAHNEPPELLIATIKAVEAIEYPNFEIIVMDNNTSDPAVWRPVEEYCRGRDRVRFVHVEDWPGFKAGACNLALRQYTDPRAEIIALVDADDIVAPYYLRETVGYFSDPRVGFVQTFEGNREYEGSSYYTACVDSYQAFYLAVMSSRNERDAVPFVGTMGMFRKSALVAVGGWNEWCISEDTEASLRALKAGWSGVYVPRCFGRGVVPPSFAGFQTQHFRWCFGSMQILRLHWRSLMPWDRSPDNHLSAAQRRDYLMGCLGWTRDLMMVAFTLCLLAISGLLLSGSHFALTPLSGDKSLMPMSLILVATVCMTWTLRHWTTVSLWRSLKALVVSLSSTWITAIACVEGLTRQEGVFKRTSKTATKGHRLRNAVRLSRWETVVGGSLVVSGVLLAIRHKPPLLLIFIIVVQGLVFLSTPITALWNLRAQRVERTEYRRRFEEQRRQLAARRRASYANIAIPLGLALAVAVGVTVAAMTGPGKLLPGNSPAAAAPATQVNVAVSDGNLPPWWGNHQP
jgi:cellulose synthase/poly-beta-1,6-N-acetylglucosamine synthase-like glycosyltransferase